MSLGARAKSLRAGLKFPYAPPCFAIFLPWAFGVFFVWTFVSSEVLSQSNRRALPAEWVEIREEGALVYLEPQTSSSVLAELSIGGRFLVSKELFGEFRRIRLKDQLLGFVKDQDVISLRELNSLQRLDPPFPNRAKRPSRDSAAALETPVQEDATFADSESKRLPASRTSGKNSMELPKPQKPYEFERFRGLKVSTVQFKEETMGLRPTDTITLLGFHFAGPRITHDFYTDLNLHFFLGAPKYYQQQTGEEAGGFMVMPSFLLQSVLPQGRDTMLFYGLGPFLRYSSWQVSARRGTGMSSDQYDLSDASLGLVLNAGVGVRFESFNARLELQHYWEKTHYSGLGFSVGMPF